MTKSELNTDTRHTETHDNSFDLLRSQQQCIPWSPPLETEPVTTDCRAESIQLSRSPYRTQVTSIDLNVSCKLHPYSLQWTRSPPGPRLPKRIRNTHLRNYHDPKGKDVDPHFSFLNYTGNWIIMTRKSGEHVRTIFGNTVNISGKKEEKRTTWFELEGSLDQQRNGQQLSYLPRFKWPIFHIAVICYQYERKRKKKELTNTEFSWEKEETGTQHWIITEEKDTGAGTGDVSICSRWSVVLHFVRVRKKENKWKIWSTLNDHEKKIEWLMVPSIVMYH